MGVRIMAMVITLILFVVTIIYIAGSGCFGTHEGPGEVTTSPIPQELLASRAETQRQAAVNLHPVPGKQILFGDFHVHSTYSLDAFLMSLPVMQGEGTHPVADACDFARYCSALDFWSINDHAEALTPQRWQETIDSIRQCNAVTDSANPDVVAFLGWEWTQIGATPEKHFGHKNVILAGVSDDEVPTRPIAARGFTAQSFAGPGTFVRGLIALRGGGGRLHDLTLHLKETQDVPFCEDDVHVKELPVECREFVTTPKELYRKLDEWGHESIVIPHGTTWGFYTPPGSTWDKQLVGDMHDPNRQTLIEVYSGHGNSEEHRPWRAVNYQGDGQATCPEPSKGFLPSCWKAGEIIRERCLKEGIGADECEKRAVSARQHAASALGKGHLTVPGVLPEEWLDSGQCRDCFTPSFNYRPGSSVQYIMALRNFDQPNEPRRFDFGFIASSDVHTSRPGTGYKEYDRREMTEAMGAISAEALGPLMPKLGEPIAYSHPEDPLTIGVNPIRAIEAERQASFFLTGGLVAVHSEGRHRDAIWRAVKKKEVYGTSGPRILLWFDMLDAGGGELPMGSGTRSSESPTFRVRAVGSFEQKPGCPDYSPRALDADRMHHLCRGECYNPGDERRLITRIEVVRIRPQQHKGEAIAPLIEDPWFSHACPADPAGCTLEFNDADFATGARDTLYYVRAIEEPSVAVNSDHLRPKYDERGRVISVDPCWGDFRTDYQEDCLGQIEERAWSSPIFVEYAS